MAAVYVVQLRQEHGVSRPYVYATFDAAQHDVVGELTEVEPGRSWMAPDPSPGWTWFVDRCEVLA